MQSHMFGNVVRILCRDRRGRTLVAGAIGVLTGVQYLLSTREVQEPAKEPKREPLAVEAQATPAPVPVAAKSRIKISQTRSELGYVYWVVRELGANPSYVLFDTWQEAMNEATRRMAVAQPEESLVTA